MTEAAFSVLASLLDEPLHGYGIMQAVRALSSQRAPFPVATVYAVLDRLTADGLVEVDHEEIREGRLRRYYRVTDDGARALSLEAQRLAKKAEVATERVRVWSLRPSTTDGLG
ncbi:MAG: PadR family transcriptional regulator [Actinomycetota bacterium]|nr:PadR family transcriptional regulator [Actinomycetota bacterium]